MIAAHRKGLRKPACSTRSTCRPKSVDSPDCIVMRSSRLHSTPGSNCTRTSTSLSVSKSSRSTEPNRDNSTICHCRQNVAMRSSGISKQGKRIHPLSHVRQPIDDVRKSVPTRSPVERQYSPTSAFASRRRTGLSGTTASEVRRRYSSSAVGEASKRASRSRPTVLGVAIAGCRVIPSTPSRPPPDGPSTIAYWRRSCPAEALL
jgi:hypothetical protein